MFGNARIEEATLYYLYMLSDGTVENKEKKIFDNLCKELNVDSEEKKEIINKCKTVLDNQPNVIDIIVTEKYDEQVGKKWIGMRSVSELAQVIWNLVRLGYADAVYSAEEKEIVNYLMDKWSIAPEVYQEFIDTAETLLSLKQYKSWISTAYTKGNIQEEKKKNIENEMQMLRDDVQLTINELTM